MFYENCIQKNNFILTSHSLVSNNSWHTIDCIGEPLYYQIDILELVLSFFIQATGVMEWYLAVMFMFLSI